jgi:ATP/maltotriose-dependent transcriptional regulator MalT
MVREADKALWDYDGGHQTVRQVRLARDAGALDRLPFLLNVMALDAVYSGNLAAATSLIAEAEAVSEATGSRIAPYAATMLASFRGREAEASPQIQATIEQAAAGGQGVAVTWANRSAAILYNGLGRHADALAAAQRASGHGHVYVSMSTLPELIEAATRTGHPGTARDALDLLAMRTRAGGTEDGLGIEARSRALLSEAAAAEGHYREAIDRLGRTRRRPELARAHLLYGEWLRRQGRRMDARVQLRTAHQMLDAIGMEAFAERARGELRATGETVRKRTAPAARTDGASAALTAQEAQVAGLARDGLSNPEIGARLFISPRTAQYHLSSVFTKLGISSRSQLDRVLPGPDTAGPR